MYKIEEMYGSIYCKDRSTDEILYEIEEPSVCFSWEEDLKDVCVHKLGDKSFVQEYYEDSLGKLRKAGLSEIADSMYLCDLPKDVTELQNIYDNHSILISMFKALLERKT